ncbi:MAG: hypothetical protein LBT74_13940 [Acidobacteriota bacterium]|jgi:hypothetical protein|nr:hypothetical protein [Acidobacteriota bacterium]
MLTEQQRQKYEITRQMAKEELDSIDREIGEELARAKDRILELQHAKRAVKQIYDGACDRMGVRPALEIEELGMADLVETA